MFWKSIFISIQGGGGQQETKQLIKLHMNFKYISPYFFCRILFDFETYSV